VTAFDGGEESNGVKAFVSRLILINRLILLKNFAGTKSLCFTTNPDKPVDPFEKLCRN